MQDEGSHDLSSLKAFQNKSQDESVFFSLKHFGDFLLGHFGHKHFGHLSHSCIKTHHSSVF